MFDRDGFLTKDSVYVERGREAWTRSDPVKPSPKFGLMCDPCKADRPGYECWGEIWCNKVNKVAKLYCTPLNKIQ